MTTRIEFANALLARLGYPTSQENQLGLVAWASAENTAAANNPLATTFAYAGASDFNAAGVKNYPSFAAGVEATALTLALDFYDQVRSVLSAGVDAHALARSVGASKWGTGDFSAVVDTVAADPPAYYGMEIGYGGIVPPAPEPPAPEPPAPSPGVCTVTVDLPVLQEGATLESGVFTKKLQGLLQASGNAAVAIDGVFGPATKAGVEAFQNYAGIAVDGIVGPDTWTKLLTV